MRNDVRETVRRDQEVTTKISLAKKVRSIDGRKVRRYMVVLIECNSQESKRQSQLKFLKM